MSRQHPPLFILGIGRCGSTMLSNLIRQHPYCLSLSEFFAFVSDLGFGYNALFSRSQITGADFWALITARTPRQTFLLRHHLVIPEVLYPFTADSTYQLASGLPAILQTTLPHLTPQFEDLFAQLQVWCQQQPTATPMVHCRRLFDELTGRFQKRYWVERSGGSIRIVKQLVKAFPQAKFLHLVRDGRDCALSMSQHIAFRFVMICLQQANYLRVKPFENCDRKLLTRLPPALQALLPENFSVRAFWDYPLSPVDCARYWSFEMEMAMKTLRELPSERLTTLYFDDFLAKPRQSVTDLAYFLDPSPELSPSVQDWIDTSILKIKQPRSCWRRLPLAEQQALKAACNSGFVALDAYH
ncbi:MAG: sulfotransferase [Cyanobacteria bacterium P01_H01_bin.15]